MLEQKIETLTGAVQALTAQLASWLQQGQAPTSQPATVVTQAAPAAVSFGGATGTPLPNGMPGGPFGGSAAAAAFTPPPAAPASNVPFSDLPGFVKYATDSYYALEAKGAGRGAVIGQLCSHLGVAGVNDVKPEQFEFFYTELEKQKAI